MGKIVRSLIAIVTGAAVVLIPAGSLSRSYGTTLQPIPSGNYGTVVEVKNYVPPPPKQDKKEEPIQTVYFNLKVAFGRPNIEIERLLRAYLA